jgi:cytochrome c-type biogenesis protein CcmF
MVRRNRRRYGGYIVHVGIAVLFIGVAASSTFQHEQQLSLGVGQSVRVGAYTMKYERASGSVVNDPNHTGATMTLGAVLRVTRGGHYVTTLRPSAGYYPGAILPGQVVSGLISGDAVDQVGLQSSWRRDLWAAIKPFATTIPAIGSPLPEAGLVAQANALVPTTDSTAKQLGLAYYVLLPAIVRHYVNFPPPASFTLIASPLVMWIWIGGLIVLLGGLTAIWPSPAALRSRVRARYLARVAQELGRA